VEKQYTTQGKILAGHMQGKILARELDHNYRRICLWVFRFVVVVAKIPSVIVFSLVFPQCVDIGGTLIA
jgi:hypothetical protein